LRGITARTILVVVSYRKVPGAPERDPLFRRYSPYVADLPSQPTRRNGATGWRCRVPSAFREGTTSRCEERELDEPLYEIDLERGDARRARSRSSEKGLALRRE